MTKNFDEIVDIEKARMKREREERNAFLNSLTEADVLNMQNAVESFHGTEQVPDAVERFQRVKKLLKLAVIGGESAISCREAEINGYGHHGVALIDICKNAYFDGEQLRVIKEAIVLADDLSITVIGILDEFDLNDSAGSLAGVNSNIHIRIGITVRNVWK